MAAARIPAKKPIRTQFSMRTGPARGSALRHIHAVGTLHGAAGTIAAADRGMFGIQLEESLAAQGKLAVAIRIGGKRSTSAPADPCGTGRHIRRTAAIHGVIGRRWRARIFSSAAEKGLGERFQVFIQLVHVGHAGDRGAHVGVTHHPCECRRAWRRPASAFRWSRLPPGCGTS